MKRYFYILVFLLFAGHINAQQDIYRFKFGVDAGRFIERNSLEKYSMNMSTHINYNFNKSFALGVKYLRDSRDPSNRVFLNLTYFTDNDYLFFSRAKFSPYAGIGVEATNFERNHLYRLNFGLKFRFFDRFNLYSQISYESNVDMNYHNTEVQLGLSYSFGYYNNDYSPPKILSEDKASATDFAGNKTFVDPKPNFYQDDSLLVLDTFYLSDTILYEDVIYNSGKIFYTDTIINKGSLINSGTIFHSDSLINSGVKYYSDTVFISKNDSLKINDTLIYNDSISFIDTIFYNDEINYTDSLNYTDTIVYTDSAEYFDTVYYSTNLIYTDTLLYVKSAYPHDKMRELGMLIPYKEIVKENLKYIYKYDTVKRSESKYYNNVEYSQNDNYKSGEVKLYREDGELKMNVKAGSDLNISIDENLVGSKQNIKTKNPKTDTNKLDLNFGSNENLNYLDSRIGDLETKLEKQETSDSKSQSKEIRKLRAEIASLQQQVDRLSEGNQSSEVVNKANNEKDDYKTVFDSKENKTGLLDDIVREKRKTKIEGNEAKRYKINDTLISEYTIDSNNMSESDSNYYSSQRDSYFENDSLKDRIINLESRMAILENYISKNQSVKTADTSDIKSEMNNKIKPDTVYKVIRDTLVKTNEKVITKERDISVNKELRFVKFYYETNVYKLTNDQKSRLNKLISAYKTNENFKILISGYTDGKGSAEYNKILSNKRINAIVDYMITKGVEIDRIYKINYGQSKSGSGENSEDRRVEVRLFDFY